MPQLTSSQSRRHSAQPRWVEPMLAKLVKGLPPTDPHNWAYEIKWDGVRALAFHDGASFKLFSRNHLDATFRYPEIVELAAALGSRTAILDGEIIALDKKGEPSFPELQKRMNVTTPAAVKRAELEVPVWFMAFDLLYLDGHDLRQQPWHQRRLHLEKLAQLFPPACRLSPMRLGSQDRGEGGQTMLATALKKQLEGVVGKRVDSLYEAGERSGAWIKVKLVQQQELVVGGWVPQVSIDGQVRSREIGALLLGYFGKDHAFHFAGAVGTGYSHESSKDLVKRLKPLASTTRPFTEGLTLRKFRAPIHWVTPSLVVEVEYRRWPVGKLMHQAAFKGIRTDKSAKEVVREFPGG